jgi:hypothetical protein
MQTLRRLLFYLFAAVYLVSCPLVILYAFGYIYEPGTDRGYARTGLIYLSTAPTGANIYLDGKPFTGKTPAAVRELMPGTYDVRLRKEGYRTWRQKVPVEEEKATVLDRVLLIPDEWRGELLAEGEFAEILDMEGVRYFITGRSSGQLQGTLVCDPEAGEVVPIAGGEKVPGGAEVERIHVSRNSSYVLIEAESSGKARFLWRDIGDKGSDPEDVTRLIPEDAKTVRWEAGRDRRLYVRDGNSITAVDVDKGAVYPDIVEKVRGFGLYSGDIYALDASGRVFMTGPAGGKEQVLMEADQSANKVFTGGTEYDIEVVSGSITFFLGDDGSLVVNKLPYRFVEEGVSDVKMSADGNKALVVAEKRIGIIDFSAEHRGQEGFEFGPELTWVYDRGRNIEQGYWAYGGSHILFRDGNTVFLLEVERCGECTLRRLFDVKRGSAISYSDKLGYMYFIDEEDNALRGVQIIPVKGLIQVPFPGLEKDEKKNRVQELTRT